MSEKKKWFEKISFFQKIKNIKNIEIIIAVIFAVVIFLIYLSTTSGKTNLLGTANTSASQTAFETRLCSILADIDGAGNVSVFVHNENDKIVGIVVVSSGAENVGVRLNILRAIQTVLTVPGTNIEILVGNK